MLSAQSELEQEKAYIAAQERHHRTMSFADEYRARLKRYRVAFDEHHVWDQTHRAASAS